MTVIDRAKNLGRETRGVQICSAPRMAHSYLSHAASRSMLSERTMAMKYSSRQVQIGPFLINILARAVGRRVQPILAYTVDGETRSRIRCEVQPPDAESRCTDGPANSTQAR